VKEKSGGPDQLVLTLQPQVLRGVPDGIQGSDGKVPRCRQGLADGEKALFVENDAVRKCPSDIDADCVVHGKNFLYHTL